MKIIEVPKANTSISLSYHSWLKDEVVEWANKNVAGTWEWHPMSEMYDQFVFSDVQDAILFKLRWG